MSYLEKRRNLWYAKLTIPEKVRERIGKLRYFKSLGTPDKKEAERLSPPLIAKWKAEIRQAEGAPNAVAEEAQRWKDALSQVTGYDREILEHVLLENAEKLADTKGHDSAKEYYDLATGAITPSDTHFEEWKANLKLATKTIDQMVKDVQMLIKHFGTLEAITKKNVKSWLDGLASHGKSKSSLSRMISSSRNYWKYLQAHEAVSADIDPFFGALAITKAVKNNGGEHWVPFGDSDVVTCCGLIYTDTSIGAIFT